MAASYPNPPGRPPRRESQRRRRNVPKSYGLAEPTTAPAAEPTGQRVLDIDGAHPFVTALWDTVQTSCECAYYSEADWQRLRLELWYVNTVVSGQPSATAWSTIQSGLNEMLLSPAVKRRAGIELRRKSVDADMVAAGEMVSKYKRSLKSV